MLDYVERSKPAQTSVGNLAQRLECIAQLDREAMLKALLDRGAIGVDTGGGQTRLAKHFEQFAAAAAEVKDRRSLTASLGGAELWEVHGEPPLDLFPGSAELVLEMKV